MCVDLDIIIAVLNLLILGGTLFVAYTTYKSQKIHNYNSVKPILQLDLGDYEDDIYVRLYNNGVGPAIIKSIKIVKSGDNATRSDIIGYFENLEWEWDVFNTGLEGVAIAPNQYTFFIDMKNPNDDQKRKLRNTLRKLQIQVDYVDIYGNLMLPINEDLSWFERDNSYKKAKARRKNSHVINVSNEGKMSLHINSSDNL